MIDFKEAEETARRNFGEFVSGADNVILEEIVISDDNKTYEITFSYDVQRSTMPSVGATTKKSSLFELANVLGRRREFKTFLVASKDGKLKGFKRYKDQ